MSIEVRDVRKSYGKFNAVRGVSLHVGDGELVALLGPSGSGKTTLLRLIAGLEQPDGGEILLDGRDATPQSAAQRRVGFVFQHYALFKHMTSFENVAFGLRVQTKNVRLSSEAIRSRVMDLLKLVQLETHATHFPSQLSGGQRQRVALARALAVQPKVLLLDEPFGALDAKVRKELRRWLRRLQSEIHVTTVLVTHDQEEALEVADRVAIMNQGLLEQVGSSDAVYDHPASPFVFDFLGNVNIFHGRAQANTQLATTVADEIGYVRPHEIELRRVRDEAEGWIKAQVAQVYAAGPLVKIDLRRSDNGGLIQTEIPRRQWDDLSFQVGEIVFARPTSIRFFEKGQAN
jgi:sulfate transport system ATP-binding protein